ncbi:peptidase M24, structural domain-containing protein [Chytridium lagenaria]|nr:peptidase M24, structural domain-containing protein [Chytridium lagenaria]
MEQRLCLQKWQTFKPSCLAKGGDRVVARCHGSCGDLRSVCVVQEMATGDGDTWMSSESKGWMEWPSWRRWWRWHRRGRSLGDVCPFKELDLPDKIFPENRAKLFKHLEEAIKTEAALHGSDDEFSILLGTAPRPQRDGSDAEFQGWKQTPNVEYLLGPLTISGAAVLLSPAKGVNATGEKAFKITLYLPEHLNEFLIDAHGLDDVKPMSDLWKDALGCAINTDMNLRLEKRGRKHHKHHHHNEEKEEHDHKHSHRHEDDDKKIRNSLLVVSFLCLMPPIFIIKSSSELKALERASNLAAWSHKKAERYLASAKTANEIEVASAFEALGAICGGRLQSYAPIVGAGPHGAILHYRTGENLTAGYAPIIPGSLVLIDAAPEYRGYASDLTRTYIRGGSHGCKGSSRHSPAASPQSIERNAVEKLYGEGKWWFKDVVEPTMRYLTTELRDAGFLVGEVDELVKKGAAGVFMPHGLGHPVGLEVHDPTPIITSGLSTAAYTLSFSSQGPAWPRFPFPNSTPTIATKTPSTFANDFRIPRGHVATIEPGVYFIPLLLESIRNDPNQKDGLYGVVGWEKLDKGNYVEIVGGVRIEDVVAIDGEGAVKEFTRL